MWRMILTIVFVLSFFSQISSQTLSVNEIFTKVVHSVVKVYAFDFYEIEFSQGSGVVIDTNIIVTNYHVFNGCEKLEIEHFGKRYNEVKILLAESDIDILILYVNNLNLKPIEIANSNNITIGDKIYAVGSPKGFENTITDGIISGIRQKNESIQISAGITFGSSGGAVVNEEGKLIGISTLGLAFTNINLNFAIPSAYVLDKSKWCNKEDLICLKKIATYCKAYNLITVAERQVKMNSEYDYSENLNSAIQYIIEALEIDPTQVRAKDLVFYIIKKYPFNLLNTKQLNKLDAYIPGLKQLLEGIEMFEFKLRAYNAYTNIIDAINIDPKNKNYFYFLGKYYGLIEKYDLAIKNMIKAYKMGDLDAQEWLYNIGFRVIY